jgi:hypothetical protein
VKFVKYGRQSRGFLKGSDQTEDIMPTTTAKRGNSSISLSIDDITKLVRGPDSYTMDFSNGESATFDSLDPSRIKGVEIVAGQQARFEISLQDIRAMWRVGSCQVEDLPEAARGRIELFRKWMRAKKAGETLAGNLDANAVSEGRRLLMEALTSKYPEAKSIFVTRGLQACKQKGAALDPVTYDLATKTVAAFGGAAKCIGMTARDATIAPLVEEGLASAEEGEFLQAILLGVAGLSKAADPDAALQWLLGNDQLKSLAEITLGRILPKDGNLHFTIVAGQREIEMLVRLRGIGAEQTPLGLNACPVTEKMRQALGLPAGVVGFMVNDLPQDSAVKLAGLEPGVVIENLWHRTFANKQDLIDKAATLKKGDQVPIGFWKETGPGKWERSEKIISIP